MYTYSPLQAQTRLQWKALPQQQNVPILYPFFTSTTQIFSFAATRPLYQTYISNDAGRSWKLAGLDGIQTMTSFNNTLFAARFSQFFQGVPSADSIRWQQLPNPDSFNRQFIQLASNTCGIWGVDTPLFLLSRDQGRTFQFIEDLGRVSSIIVTDKVVYANNFPLGSFRSDDCGTTWNKIPKTDSLSLLYADDNVLFAGDRVDFKYLRSKNNGMTWQECITPDSVNLISFIRYGNSFYAVGNDWSQNQKNTIYRSDDSCRTWQRDSEGLPTTGVGNLVFHKNALYVGTRQGMYRADLTTTSVQEKTEKTKEIYLYQNTPNPFSQTTIISFDLSEDSNVKLTLHNPIGQEILVLADGRFTKGGHSIIVDASSFASGIYTYRLQTSAQVLAKQMLIIR